LLEAMGRYDEALAGEGPKPSFQGRRVAFDGPARKVTGGAFAVEGGLVAGFWLRPVRDMDEAVEWARRCPSAMPRPSGTGIRPVFEAADFEEAMTSDLPAREERLRAPTGR
jgi:hypothetical protein